MTPADLLRAAIAKSGLTQAQFADRILAGRDPRTLRRWLAGGVIPPRVVQYLSTYLGESK